MVYVPSTFGLGALSRCIFNLPLVWLSLGLWGRLLFRGHAELARAGLCNVVCLVLAAVWASKTAVPILERFMRAEDSTWIFFYAYLPVCALSPLVLARLLDWARQQRIVLWLSRALRPGDDLPRGT